MQLKGKDISVPTSLVLDLGTAQVKHGWSTGGQPTAVFPTVVGRGRHKGAMQKLGLRDSYVGRKAQARRGILRCQPDKHCAAHRMMIRIEELRG